MFSGFSNQVTSWMGAVKGEPHDEEVPSPTVQQSSSSEPQQQQQQPQQSSDPQNSQPLEDVPIAIEGEEGANVQRWVPCTTSKIVFHIFYCSIFNV